MPMRRWVPRLPNTIAQKQNECLRALQLFRRTTSKFHSETFSKTIDKSFPLWYNILVRMREAERQTDHNDGAPTAARLTTPIRYLEGRTTADEDGVGCGSRHT